MSLSEAMLLDDVRHRLFSPTYPRNPRAVGAELELIPVDPANRVVSAPVCGRVISGLAVREGWLDHAAGDDRTLWNLPDGSAVSFEPGGQIEISSSLHATASSLIESLQRLGRLLEREMKKHGITLIARGVDPYNDIDSVPLQLQSERYVRMTEYFNSLGAAGIRMMRQTAAVQINVERGSDPVTRWRLLNAIAPVVIALFANSRQYAGSNTDYASYRAQLWRTLDASRTGLAYNASDPARHYLSFALEAGALRSGSVERQSTYQSFREWMQRENVSVEEWEFHLSTLFPEVRPKAYFELRSADTIDAEWVAAPIVFVTGLVYDSESARVASDLIGEPSSSLMETAGKLGLDDAHIKQLAGELVQLSLRGARSLGESYVSARHIGAAREYFARTLDGN